MLGTSTNTDLLVNGAAVTASGRLRNITVSDGTLAPGPGRATLTVAEVDFTGGRLECEIDATDSDRLIITGPGDTCDFSGAAELALLSPASLPPGTARTIIDVQGSSPVRPFRLHPEASTLIAPGGQRYRINYAAGDGNECTLTALAPAPPPDLRFTEITTTDDLNEGIRSLHLTVSGGEGAIGLGIPFETSTDAFDF